MFKGCVKTWPFLFGKIIHRGGTEEKQYPFSGLTYSANDMREGFPPFANTAKDGPPAIASCAIFTRSGFRNTADVLNFLTIAACLHKPCICLVL